MFGPDRSTVEADGGSGIAPTESPALITRDHHDITAPSRAPFDELAHEGAALIIAGFDPEGALFASRYAESESIVVIVVATPSQPVKDARFTFVVGEDDETLTRGLMDAAGQGGRKAARVGGPASPAGPGAEMATPCDARAVRAGEPRFPLARWRTAGVGAIALAGHAHCAHDVFLELALAKYSPTVLIGPEALGVQLPKGYAGTIVQAKVGMVNGAPRDAAMEAWVRSHGDTPGWYESLGRDAAALARAAVAGLPKGKITDLKEVAARRAAVKRALESARADLWTTKEKGFSGGRKLSREILY